MKFVPIFFFVLCINSAASAQISDSLLAYYEGVNRAEMHIVEGEYEKAAQLYEKSFALKAQPFGVDLYNRALCAVILKDYVRATDMLTHLTSLAYPVDSLKTNEAFADYFQSAQGKKWMENEPAIERGYNRELREVYDSLLVADQAFRLKEGSYAVYGDTIAKIDRAIRRYMLELISENGFPSDYLIGVYPYFDYKPFKMVVTHSQVGSSTEDTIHFIETLYEGIYEGSLDNRAGVQLLVGAMGNDVYGFHLMGAMRYGYEDPSKGIYEMSDWGVLLIDQEKEKRIDLVREEIGLCSLEETRQKALFTKRNDLGFRFSQGAIFKTYISAEWEDYLEHKKRLIIPE